MILNDIFLRRNINTGWPLSAYALMDKMNKKREALLPPSYLLS
jgi:hypothetical protein